MLNHVFLGPLEQEIMNCLWRDKKPKKVSQIHFCLSRRRKVAYTTVMTVMARLKDKGLLRREKRGKAYQYCLCQNKQQTIKLIVNNIIDNLVNQFGKEAIVNFADKLDSLSPGQQKKIAKKLKSSKVK